MFWKYQLRLEFQRHGTAALLLALALLVRGLLPGTLHHVWRLPVMLLIALVVLAEPFERRAFWRTRPIPRGALALAKGCFVLLTCWLPSVLSQTLWLWRLGPQEGGLFWLMLASAQHELFVLLTVVAVVMAAGAWGRALPAMLLLWFGGLLWPSLELSVWMSPWGIRGGHQETHHVLLLVATPALLIWIVIQVCRRSPRPGFLGLAMTSGLALLVVMGLRNQPLPLRLDAAPLHPEPWDELATLHLTADPGALADSAQKASLSDQHPLAIEVALDRPLPPGHGLSVRQVRSTLTLTSGEHLNSWVTGGAWTCPGRRTAWHRAGLEAPDTPSCPPGLSDDPSAAVGIAEINVAEVPVAEIGPATAREIRHSGARLVAEVEVDLFRFELRRVPFDTPDTGPVTAGCQLRSDPSQGDGAFKIYRRSFPGLWRQYRLKSYGSYVLIPAEQPEEAPQTLPWDDLGGGRSFPSNSMMAWFPAPHDEVRGLHRTDSVKRPGPQGLRLPAGTALVCEERILVDRATLRLEVDS